MSSAAGIALPLTVLVGGGLIVLLGVYLLWKDRTRRAANPSRKSASADPGSGVAPQTTPQSDVSAPMTTVGATSIPVLAFEAEDEPTGEVFESQVLTLIDGDLNLDDQTGSKARYLVDAVARTDAGRLRKRNEDYYLTLPKHGLYLLADGMGGCAGGEVASKLALEAIAEAFENGIDPGVDDPNRPRRANELAHAIQRANATIHKAAVGDLVGMGTTLLAAHFAALSGVVYIAHVGDSRGYLLRDGELRLLTRDHTLASYGVEGPVGLPLRRALGVKATVKVDMVIAAPKPRDLFMLCSDGVTKMLPDDRIRELLVSRASLERAADALIDAANEAGGRDNITVLLMQIGPAAR